MHLTFQYILNFASIPILILPQFLLIIFKEANMKIISSSLLAVLILFCSVAVSQTLDISNSHNTIQRIYQEDGSLLEIKTLLEWNNNQWENSWRSIYTYDTNNILVEEVGQGWNINIWNNMLQVSYSYDVNNNLIEQIAQMPIGTNSTRVTHSYDGNDNRIETTFQIWAGSDWENSTQVQFTYNASNNLTEELRKEWAGSDWINVEKYIYSYITTGVEKHEELDFDYNVSNNYPNPFNPSTKIKYKIPALSFVTIKVFDPLGKEVATLVNEEKPMGNYEITWNAENLPSGVYFYQMKAGNFIQTRKMLLLK